MVLNEKQADKLADLLMDIAKGLFLLALALPIVTKSDTFAFIKYAIGGILFSGVSLYILRKKRRK